MTAIEQHIISSAIMQSYRRRMKTFIISLTILILSASLFLYYYPSLNVLGSTLGIIGVIIYLVIFMIIYLGTNNESQTPWAKKYREEGAFYAVVNAEDDKGKNFENLTKSPPLDRYFHPY